MWSVQAAMASQYVDKIVVSSNCEGCREVFDTFQSIADELEDERSLGVRWIQRPDELATPTSKNEEALIHAVEAIKEEDGFGADVVVNLQPTSPCRTDHLIDSCLEMYASGFCDSVLTGTRTTPFLWRKGNSDYVWEYKVDRNECCNRKMRQDFMEEEFLFHDNGNVYISKVDILLATKCRIGYNPCVFETDGINCLQIDTEFDFMLIEKLSQSLGLNSLIGEQKCR